MILTQPILYRVQTFVTWVVHLIIHVAVTLTLKCILTSIQTTIKIRWKIPKKHLNLTCVDCLQRLTVQRGTENACFPIINGHRVTINVSLS